MSVAFRKVQTVLSAPEDCPEKPTWFPETFVYTGGMYQLSSQRNQPGPLDEQEDGEVQAGSAPELVALLGPGLNGPRLFLHYDNLRFTRFRGRSLEHKSIIGELLIDPDLLV